MVGILLMLTILAMVASLMLLLGSSNLRMARNEIESEKALNAAEAGLAIALEHYIRDQAYSGEVTPVGFGSTGQTYTINLYDSTTGSPDGTNIPDNHTLIRADGFTQRGTTRTVTAMVTARLTTQAHDNALLAGDRIFLENAFLQTYDSALSNAAFAFYTQSSAPLALAQAQQLSLSGPFGTASVNLAANPPKFSFSQSSTTSSVTFKSASAKRAPSDGSGTSPTFPKPAQALDYDKTATYYDTSGTNSNGGNAHIAVSTDDANSLVLGYGSSVDGELRIPDGADAETVIRNDSGADTLGVNDAYSPPAMVPVRLPLAPGEQDITWTGQASTADFLQDGQLKPGAYRDLVVDGGTLLLNSSGSKSNDLYVFNSITLKNGGQIVLPKEAKSNKIKAGLYVDKKLEIVDGSVVNKTNDPSRLQMYVSDEAPVRIDVREDSELMLYAPGSKVDITGGDLYGNVVGKEIQITGGATVHYDKQLAKIQPDPWGNGGFYAFWKSYQRR